MRMARFSGYPLTLRSPLSAEECLRRLDNEFYDRRGNWQHARSDPRLVGWQERRDFLIFPSWRFDYLLQSGLLGSSGWDTSRACRLRIRPTNDGCTLIGTYRYAQGDQLLAGFIFAILFVPIIGIALLIGGLVAASFWMMLFGIAAIAACCVPFIGNDDDFLRERDYIASFLARVLDSDAPDASKSKGPTVSKSAPRPGVRVVR